MADSKSFIDTIPEMLTKDPKKTLAGLFAALLALNFMAVSANLTLQSSLGSPCQVYLVDTNENTVDQSTDYNQRWLTNYVSANTIPKWVNPLWRMPTVSIQDASGAKTFVQGDIVQIDDDQYNIFKSKTSVTQFAEKLEAVDVSSMKFPITLKWTQIEGAEVHRVMMSALALAAIAFTWSAVVIGLSFKGHEFFQNFILWSAFASMWFIGGIKSANDTLTHPPTSAEIAEIPESLKGALMQPCKHSDSTGSLCDTMMASLFLQSLIFVCLRYVGKSIAKQVNEAAGVKDNMFFNP